MFIARELKKKNIVEYLLYMWQVEDMLRANRFDIGRIRENIVAQYSQSDDATRQQLEEWYRGLMMMMQNEGIKEQGHLQINKNLLADITDLHLRLNRSPKYPYYTAAYYKALPFLVEFRKKSRGEEKPEIENAADALYGVWMLRLQKRPVSPDTARAIESISQWLGILADYYQKESAGELEF